jgi:hypothetical protein
MMDRTLLRKPKLHFDAAANASHVTFDDGQGLRRNLPWLHYVEARWDYDAEPGTINMEIGDWLVVIRGHNLGSLFQAIEDHTLMRVCAQPEREEDREREFDTFATEIRFLKPLAGSFGAKGRGQIEFDLGR